MLCSQKKSKWCKSTNRVSDKYPENGRRSLNSSTNSRLSRYFNQEQPPRVNGNLHSSSIHPITYTSNVPPEHNNAIPVDRRGHIPFPNNVYHYNSTAYNIKNNSHGYVPFNTSYNPYMAQGMTTKSDYDKTNDIVNSLNSPSNNMVLLNNPLTKNDKDDYKTLLITDEHHVAARAAQTIQSQISGNFKDRDIFGIDSTIPSHSQPFQHTDIIDVNSLNNGLPITTTYNDIRHFPNSNSQNIIDPWLMSNTAVSNIPKDNLSKKCIKIANPSQIEALNYHGHHRPNPNGSNPFLSYNGQMATNGGLLPIFGQPIMIEKEFNNGGNQGTLYTFTSHLGVPSNPLTNKVNKEIYPARYDSNIIDFNNHQGDKMINNSYTTDSDYICNNRYKLKCGNKYSLNRGHNLIKKHKFGQILPYNPDMSVYF
ncbi:unnamed protein product [Gordionus sp. m RMFG-2023]